MHKITVPALIEVIKKIYPQCTRQELRIITRLILLMKERDRHEADIETSSRTPTETDYSERTLADVRFLDELLVKEELSKFLREERARHVYEKSLLETRINDLLTTNTAFLKKVAEDVLYGRYKGGSPIFWIEAR